MEIDTEPPEGKAIKTNKPPCTSSRVGFYKYLRLKLTESFFRLCIDEQAIQYPRLELQLLADRWGITLRTKTKKILFSSTIFIR